MGYNFFLAPLLISFVVSFILLVFFIFVSRKKIFKDLREGVRHIHAKGISRFGGVAMIATFIGSILLDKRLIVETPLLTVLAVSGTILFFGLLDDFWEINWKVQLAFQLFIVVAIYAFGIRLEWVTNPLGGIFLFSGVIGSILGFLVAGVWMIFLMNAMNWVDGIDGASGGIALIGSLTLFFLSQRSEVNQPPLGIIAAVLVGIFASFLILNFNPAKIMAGTGGSMFMGFILGILAIFAGAKIATTVLVLAIPIIDALWVILERLRAKDSIFSADKRHLHYRLLELGWSQSSICFLYWSITALIAFVALNTTAMDKIWSFLFIFSAMLAFLFVIKNKVAQKNV